MAGSKEKKMTSETKKEGTKKDPQPELKAGRRMSAIKTAID